MSALCFPIPPPFSTSSLPLVLTILLFRDDLRSAGACFFSPPCCGGLVHLSSSRLFFSVSFHPSDLLRPLHQSGFLLHLHMFPPLLSRLFNPRCYAPSCLWTSHVRTIFTPHQLPFSGFPSIFQLFPAPTKIFFASLLHFSFLSIRIGFVFFYSSLIFFAIVLCIPLFTFLSLVRIMDRFSTFVLIDGAIFPPRSFPSVAAHTSFLHGS